MYLTDLSNNTIYKVNNMEQELSCADMSVNYIFTCRREGQPAFCVPKPTKLTKINKPARFGGKFAYIDDNGHVSSISIKKVIRSGPATIVFWSDDTKTVAKCSDKERNDGEKGLLVAVMKKLYGTAALHALLDDWNVPNAVWTLTDLRKAERREAKKNNK